LTLSKNKVVQREKSRRIILEIDTTVHTVDNRNRLIRQFA